MNSKLTHIDNMLAIVDPLFVLPEKKYCQMIRKVVKEWLPFVGGFLWAPV